MRKLCVAAVAYNNVLYNDCCAMNLDIVVQVTCLCQEVYPLVNKKKNVKKCCPYPCFKHCFDWT